MSQISRLSAALAAPKSFSPHPFHPALLALAATVVTVACAGTTRASTVFSENFGTLADTTPISTSNTTLTYVRVGTGGGSIVATNPSTVGSDSSATITGPTGASQSLNGIGVQTGLGLTSQADLSFDIKFSDITTGTLVIEMGSGTTFTTANGFSGGQLFFGFQVLNGVLQYRNNSSSSGAWVNAGITFASGTTYHIDANQSGSALQLTVNGNPLTAITDSKNSQNADALRFYAVGGASSYEIDNILVTGTVPAPEPASLGLLAIGGLLLVRRRR